METLQPRANGSATPRASVSFQNADFNPPSFDAESLVVLAINELCAKGIPEEKAPYLNEKVFPLLARIAKFLLDSMPEMPERAVAEWLASLLGMQGDKETMHRQCSTASVASSAPRKSCLKYVTPAGTLVTDQLQRNVTVHISDEKKLEYIRQVPMFRSLSEEDLNSLLQAFEDNVYLEGEKMVKNGNVSTSMHIIVSGEAKVFDTVEVGSLTVGDVIGEEALVKGGCPHQTVEVCNGPMTSLKIDALLFKAMGLKKKVKVIQRQNKFYKSESQCIGFEQRLSHVVSGATTKITDEDGCNMIAHSIKRNRHLTDVLNLSEAQIEACSRESYKVEYAGGQNVFQKGDFGHRFYVILSGTFDVVIDPAKGVACSLGIGDSFGELAILHNSPRSAWVSCRVAGSVASLSRATFRSCTQVQMDGRVQEYSNLLRSAGAFQGRTDLEMASICNALEERYFMHGETILAEGSCLDSFYVIFDGMSLWRREGMEDSCLPHGFCFGEAALLEPEVVVGAVTVISERCTVLTLDSTSFRTLLGLEVLSPMGSMVGSLMAKTQTFHIPITNLQRCGVLGAGSFGAVTLERDLSSGSLYALKRIAKASLRKDQVRTAVLNEKRCQEMLDSDFVVRLICTYRDAANIYLLLEPCFGGELFDLYDVNEEIFGSERHAQFYASCAALGLDHIHSKRIIYRDLKLENCLLTSAGYLKLTDLGVSKVCIGKTHTLCGTADYFAPEMLRQTGHNRAVDWWALGVMIFIMMVGRAPFDAPEPMKTYQKIIKGFVKVKFPATVPESCIAMIRALCQRNPEERLTMGSLGIANFKDHPWYHSMSWVELEGLRLPAPYDPAKDEQQVIEQASRRVVDPLPATETDPNGMEDDGRLDGGCWDDEFEMGF